MAEDDIKATVRRMIEPSIVRMKERGVPKDRAVELSGQDYEVVDRIYNPTKTEATEQTRELRRKEERGE